MARARPDMRPSWTADAPWTRPPPVNWSTTYTHKLRRVPSFMLPPAGRRKPGTFEAGHALEKVGDVVFQAGESGGP
jgi:hypothetical protein